jgi:nitrite reductase/ring-hydroxylating ferredoxin subunit/DMSO/TMAO reductase YedYZ heme-binding membrane subunit
MSVGYKGISWNRQKRLYDLTLAFFLVAGAILFAAVALTLNPEITPETIIIRYTAFAAFLLLHVILCIGPLARLDARFAPLLYNRRHMGVTMFFLALIHAAFVTLQYHAFGPVNPIVSVFTSYAQEYNPYGNTQAHLAQFPFEWFGAGALFILFFMAATSHDFWLKNLGASVWKALHTLVYVAYGLLIPHVGFGLLQSERHPIYIGLLAAGFVTVLSLHIITYRRERKIDQNPLGIPDDRNFRAVCTVEHLQESYGFPAMVGEQRIAVYRHEGRAYAVSNVCRHQGGPLGEGKIVDGCITCPWHGWQYKPSDGTSPPPFEEVVETYPIEVREGLVWVSPDPHSIGSKTDGALLE